MVDKNNSYTKMQLVYYNSQGDDPKKGMNKENHSIHNKNDDYWNILVSDTKDLSFKNKIGLDFGCGCGRNIINLIERFRKFDGVDISPLLILRTQENLNKIKINKDKYDLYTCNGVDLSVINKTEYYDFIMSTIVFQHICVYDIRFSYLKEFYRLLKPDGILSFQMGYGRGHGKVEYHENKYNATETNSKCDVIVDNPNHIIDDLKKIGFKNITYSIEKSFSDAHPKWIYVRCIK
jgi:SAM-dependent methyltransferase